MIPNIYMLGKLVILEIFKLGYQSLITVMQENEIDFGLAKLF